MGNWTSPCRAFLRMEQIHDAMNVELVDVGRSPLGHAPPDDARRGCAEGADDGAGEDQHSAFRPFSTRPNVLFPFHAPVFSKPDVLQFSLHANRTEGHAQKGVSGTPGNSIQSPNNETRTSQFLLPEHRSAWMQEINDGIEDPEYWLGILESTFEADDSLPRGVFNYCNFCQYLQHVAKSWQNFIKNSPKNSNFH